MSSRHFIHDPTHLVETALLSIPQTNPSVQCDINNKIIYRKNGASQVSIVSGGGSGHEPSFASFVGAGLLSGAVAGTIFASPSAEQVRRCILHRIQKDKGVLVIVMNYTGDVLNFGMAVEKARAAGIEVDMVVVGDDAGVGRAKGGKVGRRGIAGTVLVQKIAGALAAKGASLKDVTHMAQLVADNTVSIGSSLAHVHVPGRREAEEDELAEGLVEIGMGIHNEAGSERKSTDLPGLVKTMLSHCLDVADQDRSFSKITDKDDVVLLVNNLGGVSPLELSGITNEVVDQLADNFKIKPVRILAGTFMTSLNGLGFSVSLLRVADASMLELLDAPAEASGWSAAISSSTWARREEAKKSEEQVDEEEVQPSDLRVNFAQAKSTLAVALNRLIEAEPDVTRYDTIVGDGDCGIGLKRGAEAILKMLETADKTDDLLILMNHIIQVVELAMDGTSGAIYAIFLNALAHGLRQNAPSSPQPVTPAIWAKALDSSLKALGKYTPAKPGDRTLMDALYPFVETLSKTESIEKAAAAAQGGAQGTKGMKASLGRTVYVGGEGFQEVPDPGAHGLAELLLGLSDGLKK
ncbi:Dihydroxyacetone kinase 1 [Alternaria arborescens]|uniref:Dihydroxyacetone kinase 1 n=1 Tax=Alternaria arborescens TaxID=156630 RepID=A0A4Q4SQK0_9PLEO|nr:Dihydroxyacetone kinase 1 [Alternaria arborescens]RYN39143.1 Dihydroxyacetone kinase 1 [Alternaria arborescens]RYO29717.1 Dihydroxyacetone kinase 1 [Alternaria arborescens]RYO72673.1 Dihydroxyacetone kinase 1 [Alternaria arborescens]